MTPERDADPLANLAPGALSTRDLIGAKASATASANASVDAPERLLLTFDNLDALPPAQALSLIETAHSMLGPSFVAAVACDPAALAPAAGGAEALRRRFDKLFQLTFNVRVPGASESARLVARLTGAEAARGPKPPARTPVSEPLTSAESTLLSTLAGLAADTPRGVKRYLNAYRVARGDATNRPALALMLALAQSGDADAARAMDALLTPGEGDLTEPEGPPTLAAALRATRAANGGGLSIADAVGAREAARRYRLFA
jgi:hypothetical protein